MSIHISGKKGAVAERVLFPGDPLRAEYVARNFLRDVTQFTHTRNMFGYTGYVASHIGGTQGRRVSVMGSGMGMPSLSIYTHELIDCYGVKEIIRVGTCGSLQPDIRLRDIILAQGASSESNMNRRRFRGMDFAPLASWELLHAAFETATKLLGLRVRVGNILAADMFYNEEREEWKMWAKYGVLAVEMESAELFTIAALKGIRALSILTVSDSLVTGKKIGSKARQSSLAAMVKIALLM